eukprot:gnl/Spiro4/4446_TR2211_c0_g1_i1.p2 gnl/Spiro4/4446_TR2211_c0_g1~~gnl/Spiro4/4446_TR2211_c0_g1_i1.p2  ORF type:complete len:143 (+),score=17.00 gnl/Spiro4/4446_TR2211_c0_g1_i1:69-497(+)
MRRLFLCVLLFCLCATHTLCRSGRRRSEKTATTISSSELEAVVLSNSNPGLVDSHCLCSFSTTDQPTCVAKLMCDEKGNCPPYFCTDDEGSQGLVKVTHASESLIHDLDGLETTCCETELKGTLSYEVRFDPVYDPEDEMSK